MLNTCIFELNLYLHFAKAVSEVTEWSAYKI